VDSVTILTRLFHRRWAAPVLGELHASGGAKFVTLARRLDVSPTAMRQTLDDLIEHGWVMRNPGYGHPMRPEYILTAAGSRLAPACGQVTQALRKLDLLDIGLQKWSMPVLAVAHQGWWRFGQLAERLRDITDRALSLTLHQLGEASLLTRRIEAAAPPHPIYGATATGARLGRLLLPV
jgi:DNA-binding HxlR family transcriptional regulator